METGITSLRVLVADDNDTMRGLLIGMLQGIGISQIKEASNGEEALLTLRRWTADLAFVDLQMTPVDGIEFTRAIRKAPNTPDPYLPIIMLTGHAQLGRVTEARDAGVNELLVKPLDPKVVVERLRAVIGRQRPFVRSADYVGPDRRRRSSETYEGPFRRETDRQNRRRLPSGSPQPT